MTANRNGGLHFGSRWSREEAMQHVAEAFRYARRSTRASVAMLAKWCARSPRTISYWLAGEQPLELDRVCMSPRLRRHFLRCLNAVDRRPSKEA